MDINRKSLYLNLKKVKCCLEGCNMKKSVYLRSLRATHFNIHLNQVLNNNTKKRRVNISLSHAGEELQSCFEHIHFRGEPKH